MITECTFIQVNIWQKCKDNYGMNVREVYLMISKDHTRDFL